MSDSINALERLLKLTSQRNSVLASNIANVDTPNYKARDVSFGKVLGSEMAMQTTHPNHVQGGGTEASAELHVEETQPWADKNNVELDQEVAKMTENAMLFQAGVNLLETKIRMFKNALRTR